MADDLSTSILVGCIYLFICLFVLCTFVCLFYLIFPQPLQGHTCREWQCCVCVLIDRCRIQATAVINFFPWVVDRYWSVETHYAAGGNPGAWAVDENLLRVCECHCSLASSLPHPLLRHLTQFDFFFFFSPPVSFFCHVRAVCGCVGVCISVRVRALTITMQRFLAACFAWSVTTFVSVLATELARRD